MATAAEILRTRGLGLLGDAAPAPSVNVAAAAAASAPPAPAAATPQCPAGQRYHRGGSRTRPLVGCVPEGLMGSQADLYLMSKAGRPMSASAAGAAVRSTIVIGQDTIAQYEREVARARTPGVTAATPAQAVVASAASDMLKAGMFDSPVALVGLLGAGVAAYFLFGRKLPTTVVQAAPVPAPKKSAAAVHGLSRRVRRRRRR